MFLGLDHFQNSTLAVPEEGEDDFEVSGHSTISMLPRFVVLMPAHRDRDDGNEYYIRHIRSTLRNKITDTARESNVGLHTSYVL
jgi:hypothetical protein